MNNYFIKNLQYLTTKTELNKNQLALKMGIPRQSITCFLKTKDPRASTLLKISKIYGVSIDDLLNKDLEEANKNESI